MGLRTVLALALLSLVALSGCGDDNKNFNDSGVNNDGAADAASDSNAPLPDGPATEATPDGPAGDLDPPFPDLPAGPDAFFGKVRNVVFSTNSSSTDYTLRNIKTNGTSSTTVAGFGPNTQLLPLTLAGPNGPIAVRSNRPAARVVDTESFIALPGGGRIYRYDDGTNIGLALAAGGTWTKLDDGPKAQSYGVAAAYKVGVSPDGKVLIAAKNKTALKMIRLDGSNWPNSTSPVIDVSGAGWTIQDIQMSSFTFGTTNVFLQTFGGSAAKLWRVLRDGSAKAVDITPTGADYFDFYLASARDRSVLAVVVGGGSTTNHVYAIVDGATPVIKQISGSPTRRNHYSAGTAFLDSGHPRLAVSTTGKYVAYSHGSSSGNWTPSIYVIKPDGSGRVLVTTPARFLAAVDTFRNIVWADDDNLVFWGGGTTSTLDAYHYRVSTNKLTNITKTATETAAPYGVGTLQMEGGWIDPTGKYLYGVVDDLANVGNLLCIDLTTFGSKWITTGLDLPSTATSLREDYRGVDGSPMVCLVGRKPGSPTIENVYVFDQTKSTLAVNVTKHTGTSSVFTRYLEISPDGKYCSYQTGNSGSQQYHAVKTDGTAAPQTMSLKGSTNAGSYRWTSDSSGMVFGAGPKVTQGAVYFTPVANGRPGIIYATTPGYIYVFTAE